MSDERATQDTPRRPGPRWALLAARLRVPLLGVSALGLVAMSFLGRGTGAEWPAWVSIGVFVVAFALYLRMGTVRSAPVALRLPAAGRWVAVNSPADRTPSHGVQAYGQTYAVDLVHVPNGGWAAPSGWSGPHTRPPQEFPGFGRPVLAPADGTVVALRTGARDHLAHTSLPGLALMLVRGTLLELAGRIMGNHVVLEVHPGRGADPAYVLLAHLRRESITVRRGQRVVQGDVLGECGNSGNSSEPHVHLQVMDRRSPFVAAGLPFTFCDAVDDTDTRVDIPATGRAVTRSAG